MPITVQRVEHKKGTIGYEPFVAALETAYNLSDIKPGNLRWVDVQPLSFGQPQVVVHIAKDHPDISVILRPENADGQQIMAGHEQYMAPLLLSDVRRWGETGLDLHNYRVDRWRGRPGPQTMFPQSLSLAEIVDMDHSGIIQGSTPVVEVIALLPMAPNGEFQTQFTPYLGLDVLGHRFYKVSVISENSLSAFNLLTQGQSRPVKDIDENQAMYNWMGSSVPVLSEFEQLTLPSSHGHMILIVTPVEAPIPKFDLGLGGRYDSGGPMKGGLSFGGGLRGGASIGKVSIGRGSMSGKGSIFDGDVVASSNGHQVIYHLKYLGVTPTVAQSLDAKALDKIGASLGTYERN